MELLQQSNIQDITDTTEKIVYSAESAESITIKTTR